ncbi:MAG: apolipoprotein N-acyltransferase [Candidatus Competibacteraceae bacterium]|nr:apolipoprotein N-acyltransferase [Candidatus Competibacteraceae bacterium]
MMLLDKPVPPAVADAAAIGAGALMPLAFAPFGYWPLAILLPAVLLWGWDRASPRRAALRGGLFGLGMFGFGMYWIYISLHDYGNAPAPIAALGAFIIILVMALYPALAGWLLGRWGPPPGPCRWLLVFPALWTLLDWIRSWFLTGLPWLAVGYSQIDAPLGALAPYLGVFGVGWAVTLSAGLLLALAHGRDGHHRARRFALLAALWLGAWSLGALRWVEPAGPTLRVALVQGNVDQSLKWQPAHLDTTLERYLELSLPEHGRSEVIVWPETAIPAFYQDVAPFLDALGEKAREDKVDYLIGLPTGSWQTRDFRNSVIGVGHALTFYHKRRLLPFGEYLPLRGLLLFFRDWVTIPMADFVPGERAQPLLRAGGQPVGISICFEAVFGGEIRLALPEATWLVNLSNDGWFKDSLAPHQHLQIARMRSLESARYMARATNTGVSAIIDERGRLLAGSHLLRAEVLRGEIEPLRGLTPYARFGDGPAVGLMVGLLALGQWFGRRNRATRHEPETR